jgi:hypothetical protein
MNWKRGLFRLWLLLSICWVGLRGWDFYEGVLVPRWSAASAQECFEARKDNPALGNPFGCFDGVENHFTDLIPLGRAISQSMAMIAFPPVAVFLFGYVLFWVSHGFRSKP